MNLEAMQGVTLAVAGAQDPEGVLRQIVEGIAVCQNVALARIWLVQVQPTDRGPERWLQLAASAGNLVEEGADASAMTDRTARCAWGEGPIGRIAASGEGKLVPDVDRWPGGLSDPLWAAREGVRCFAAQPLIVQGEVFGVLAVFDRQEVAAPDFAWLRTFADHAAVAISNARAFDEIHRLKQQLEEDNTYLQEEVRTQQGSILGASAVLEKVRNQIAMVAPTEASVLIMGASGTGKELVARAIHEQSRRAHRPLVRVNCGAIPGDLFESEFFGHKKGAFTGAHRDRVGRFALADGGTLFLDEVREIPLEHQAKLLRVLQEGTFERVGDEATQTVDVRIIAATNRDLAVEAREGRFRSDLYFRLGVFPIEVPPLRDRIEDIEELTLSFLEGASQRLGATHLMVLPAAELARLKAYDWPGNVRELQHVVERAAILAGDGPVRFGELLDLGPGLSPAEAQAVSEGAARAGDAAAQGALPSLEDLKALERKVIEAAWEACSRKVSGKRGAAAQLGIPASTLESKLRAHGLK